MLFSSVSLLAGFLALARFSSAQTTTSSTSACPSVVSDIPVLTTLSLTAEPTRTFYQFLPPAYTGGPSQSALPAILSFHGASRNATEQAGLDRFWDPDFQGATPFIVIYAEAHRTTWEGTPDIVDDDTVYTGHILDQIQASLSIDSDRIFASGKSDGGGFLNVLACDTSLQGRFAAFAPVSGAFYTFNDTAAGTPTASGGTCDPAVVDTDLYLSASPPVSHSCTPTATVTLNGTPTVVARVPPILEFHGGNDTTIPYNGGLGRDSFCLPTIPHWIQQWAARDNLPVTNTTSAVTSQATAFIFGSGATEGLVTHVFAGPNVSHSWPATFLNDDNQPPGCGPFGGGDGNGDGPATFNATPMIISFFNEWPKARLT